MIPLTHDKRVPQGAPVLLDTKSGTVHDSAGDVIGRSEVDERLTRKFSRYISDVAAGRRVLLDLLPRDVDSGVGYGLYSPTQDPIADLASTIQSVDQILGTRYFEDPLSATEVVLVNGSEAGGQVPTTQMAPIKVPYECVAYGLAANVPFEMTAQADFDLMAGSMYRLGLALREARELRVANLLTNANNWAAANRRAAAVKWNGGATADPMTDIYAALAASTLPVTHIIMSEAVLPWFAAGNGATATRVQNFFFTIEGAYPGNQPSPFPTILVAKAKLVNAGVPSYVWSPSPTAANVVLIRQPESREALSSSRTFRYTGTADDGVAEDGGYLVRRFFVNRSSARGMNGVVVISNDAEKILSNTVGGIITGVIA